MLDVDLLALVEALSDNRNQYFRYPYGKLEQNWLHATCYADMTSKNITEAMFWDIYEIIQN